MKVAFGEKAEGGKKTRFCRYYFFFLHIQKNVIQNETNNDFLNRKITLFFSPFFSNEFLLLEKY